MLPTGKPEEICNPKGLFLPLQVGDFPFAKNKFKLNTNIHIYSGYLFNVPTEI